VRGSKFWGNNSSRRAAPSTTRLGTARYRCQARCYKGTTQATLVVPSSTRLRPRIYLDIDIVGYGSASVRGSHCQRLQLDDRLTCPTRPPGRRSPSLGHQGCPCRPRCSQQTTVLRRCNRQRRRGSGDSHRMGLDVLGQRPLVAPPPTVPVSSPSRPCPGRVPLIAAT